MGRHLAVALIFALVLPRPVIAQASDPGAVVAAFDEALNRGDVEGALALFSEDAVVTTQGTRAGRAALRELFAQLVAEHVQLESSNQRVVGETETHTARVWRDAWRALGVAPLEADAQVLVREGTIRSLIVEYTQAALARLQAAQATLRVTQAEPLDMHAREEFSTRADSIAAHVDNVPIDDEALAQKGRTKKGANPH
jgi:ketosteroid isomerase-like protein